MELETHDPFLRRAYSKLARHWSELADRVDREESLGTINRQPEVRGNHIDDAKHSLGSSRCRHSHIDHDDPNN